MLGCLGDCYLLLFFKTNSFLIIKILTSTKAPAFMLSETAGGRGESLSSAGAC